MNLEEYILIENVYGNYVSFQEMIKPLIIAFKPNSTINILEIGCGTGISTEIVLKSRGKIKLTSIDNDQEMIEFTSQTLSAFMNANFILSDALDFVKSQPFNNFDIVVSAFTIHNMTNVYRQKLYMDILRVLKTNGLFINADKFVSDNKNRQIEGLKYRLGTYVETLMKENKLDLLKEWVTHYIDDQQPEKLLKFDKTLQSLKQIGFDKVEYILKSDIEMLGILTATK